MSNPVVEVHNLRKTYGQKVAVADLSFVVAPGEIFGILGPNGSGKSTAVECIAGLGDADAGQIRVLGIDPQTHPELIREHVGVQFQEAGLHDKISVREALTLFASFYDNPADVDELLTVLDLQDKRDAQFRSLSGGQKQRVSIALALVGNPKVAILDELTTGLDPQARRTTWEVVRRVRDTGSTVLLVTHFMEEAERLCDRLIIIDRGQILAEGSPQDLINCVDGAQSLEDVFVAITPRPAAFSTTTGA
jgi:ABC-2 type transport system ATP-binding protein